MSGGGSDVPLLELGVGLSPLLASLAAVRSAVFCCSLIGDLFFSPLWLLLRFSVSVGVLQFLSDSSRYGFLVCLFNPT